MPPLFTMLDVVARWGLPPASTLILRHAPAEPLLARHYAGMALSRHDLFNAYQSHQYNEDVEKSYLRATHLVSTVAYEGSKALLAGIYAIQPGEQLSREGFLARPDISELVTQYGMRPLESRESIRFFDLERLATGQEWIGRLVISWPAGQAYRRFAKHPSLRQGEEAQAEKMQMLALLDRNALEPPLPPWDRLVVQGSDLRAPFPALRNALQHWRGIYLIRDTHRNMSYVGKASGAENLLGRWTNYGSTTHGGNVLLRASRMEDLEFSILELVSPTAPESEVLEAEESWKIRLRTRHPFGLNAN